MTLTQFIRENRNEIDNLINSPYKNDNERRLYILNDESLYRWAKRNGVRNI